MFKSFNFHKRVKKLISTSKEYEKYFGRELLDINPSYKDFKKWRTPRRGTSNPECMNNEFWNLCIQSGLSAFSVNDALKGPSSFMTEPCWSFERFGQAKVKLKDGREVFIGGEHEDHYDPDFYIYNDVIVIDNNKVDIFTYPKEDFPPTDFHTATLIDDLIYIIGNLGYIDNRKPGETQVYRLDINTWKIEKVETSGELPGWIYEHKAELSEDSRSITISGGKVDNERLLENFDEYRLDLEKMTWKKITDNKWPRWILEREDGESNSLWEIRHEDFNRQFFKKKENEEISDAQIKLVKELYNFPSLNLKAEKDEGEDEDVLYRFNLVIDGTKIRFDEQSYEITITVEGDVSKDTMSTILTSLKDDLTKIEKAPYKLIELEL